MTTFAPTIPGELLMPMPTLPNAYNHAYYSVTTDSDSEATAATESRGEKLTEAEKRPAATGSSASVAQTCGLANHQLPDRRANSAISDAAVVTSSCTRKRPENCSE